MRGSRFLARVAPATDLFEAQVALKESTARHSDARHHCWAYRLWEGGGISAKGFDAGEPSGMAGRPILGSLERVDAIQVVCIVSRWFGGTLLGTGGLARAYGGAAREALSGASAIGALEAVSVWSTIRLEFDYEHTAGVQRAAARHRAREIEAEYGEVVTLTMLVESGRGTDFAEEAKNFTGGDLEYERLPDRLAPS